MTVGHKPSKRGGLFKEQRKAVAGAADIERETGLMFGKPGRALIESS